MPLPSRPPVPSISPATAMQSERAEAVAADPEPLPSTPAERENLPRWPQALLAVVLAALIAAAVVIAATMAVAHAHDRYKLNTASGAWMLQAWQANHELPYPPLRDDDGRFAGTRYMPLHIVLHAGLARATGEYLFSGRLIAFAAAIGWFTGVIALARQRGCPWLIAGALAAGIVASPCGMQSLCSIRGDGLALALQLWALWVIGRNDRSRGNVVVAAILCALGVLVKMTAVWAAVGIGVCLLLRHRRGMLAFIITGLLVAGLSVAMVNVITDGRFLDNILHASTAGWRGWGSVVIWAPTRLLGYISDWSPTTSVLAPAAGLATLLAVAQRNMNAVHFAWLACGGLMLVIYADAGIGENHIIEFAAITAVAAGDLWMRTRTIDAVPAADHMVDANSTWSGAWSAAQMLLAIAIAWSTLATIAQRVWRDFDQARAVLATGRTAEEDEAGALENTLAGRTFLSDDPTLAVLREQAPVVGDAFMFRGFEKSHPEWVDELIERIADHEFEVIALTREADPDSWWYRELFFGPRVTSSIAEHYRLDREEAGYWVYLPRE